jgi:hypothetical protein
MRLTDDPDIKLARQEHAQDAAIERRAEAAGLSPEAFAERHGHVYTGAARRPASDLWAWLPVVFIGFWAIAGAAQVGLWIAAAIPTTAPTWIGPALTAIVWPAAAIGAAFALHRLRARLPRLYGSIVLGGTAIIVWAITRDGLPNQLSMPQLMGVLGAAFSAVDGVHAVQATPRQAGMTDA